MKYADQAVDLTKDRPDSGVGKAARDGEGSSDQAEQRHGAGADCASEELIQKTAGAI